MFLNKDLNLKGVNQEKSMNQSSSIMEEVKESESSIMQQVEPVMSQKFYILVFQGVNSLFH
jgi:hypothetical protein